MPKRDSKNPGKWDPEGLEAFLVNARGRRELRAAPASWARRPCHVPTPEPCPLLPSPRRGTWGSGGAAGALGRTQNSQKSEGSLAASPWITRPRGSPEEIFQNKSEAKGKGASQGETPLPSSLLLEKKKKNSVPKLWRGAGPRSPWGRGRKREMTKGRAQAARCHSGTLRWRAADAG